MADEPISALTQIAAPTGTPPYPTAFTNPTTGAMLEILDTTNTSMASTGTNSKIAPGDLIKGYLAAGTGMTITETSGIVTLASSGGFTNPMTTAGDLIDGGSAGAAQRLAIGSTGQVLTVASGAPAWAAPVTGTYSTVQLTSGANSITTTLSASGLSITLPAAGTYLLCGPARFNISLSAGTVGGYIQAFTELYDSTNSVVVTNSTVMAFLTGFQTSFSGSGPYYFQGTGPIGPVVYTVSGSATINLYGAYAVGNGTVSSADCGGTSQGYSALTYIRIA